MLWNVVVVIINPNIFYHKMKKKIRNENLGNVVVVMQNPHIFDPQKSSWGNQSHKGLFNAP